MAIGRLQPLLRRHVLPSLMTFTGHFALFHFWDKKPLMRPSQPCRPSRACRRPRRCRWPANKARRYFRRSRDRNVGHRDRSRSPRDADLTECWFSTMPPTREVPNIPDTHPNTNIPDTHGLPSRPRASQRWVLRQGLAWNGLEQLARTDAGPPGGTRGDRRQCRRLSISPWWRRERAAVRRGTGKVAAR